MSHAQQQQAPSPTAAAPPARPHSAHPYMMTLSTGLFRSSSHPTRPASGNTTPQDENPPAGRSRRSRDAEWDDAWDSSSDRSDDDERPAAPRFTPRRSTSTGASASSVPAATSTNANAAPIPIRRAAETEASPPPAGAGSGSISTSWVSASYHPTPARGTPPSGPATRALASSSGSQARVATPPPAEPHAPAPTRLPPGGAWEIVETADAAEAPSTPTAKAGAEAVRADADDILRDPLHLLGSLNSSSAPPTPGRTSPAPRSGATMSRQRSVRTERRRERFVRILAGDSGGAIDIAAVRAIAWSGVPEEIRPIVWQLLLNYLPLASQPRLATLQRKRKEYSQLVEQYFGRGPASLDQQIWHQIEIDVPRTRPGAPLWSCPATQRALERILYVWAIRHPASGYVQGINDLATPFFEVFLSAYVSVDPESFDAGALPAPILAAIEADSFWCLTKLLDGIQDHYISQQPGIQRLVKRMGELIKRIDAPLAAHFEDHGVEYMQFAFRWMNCLLMREISVKCTIRMWDTYLSEGADAFSQFHLYVCSALLVKFSDRLREMDFQEIIMFLQRLPTTNWTDHDIELLLSEAFVLKNTWSGAENHFANLQVNGNNSFGMLGRT
ncbi:GTPase-activating protein gyp1 [Vanrija pseudolonga]|uniref:GTPase-activating protein gyp1 n=1 Tax=Vanrija pseudolonga TaxID=143232 RepID=A0AAF0XZE0_9TREE|nr:GTPase-activating protein gyp1 [Vanrija pseudolonga]